MSFRKPSSSSLRNRGFTLIELLVVIAIIAILASILFPTFTRAKEAGKKSVDSSNMKQLATAMVMYANDNDGGTPASMHNAGGNTARAWVFALAPYTTKVDEIRISPADPKGKARTSLKGTSYVINGYLSDLEPGMDQAEITEGMTRSFDGLARPSETMLLWVLAFAKPAKAYDDHVHSYYWFQSTSATTRWARIIAEIQPGAFFRTPSDPVEGNANYVYVDSHVKSLPARQIKAWADQNFDFAKPPQG